MHTKFKVEIHKRGEKNSDILTIIAAHNGREVPISLSDLISFASVENGKSYSENRLVIWREDIEDNRLYVSEDGGKTVTLSIEEIEVFELEETKVEKTF